MEPQLGKNLQIEFSNLGELDCKILKYQNYLSGSEEVYSDYDQFNISRNEYNNKTYIDVSQSNENETKFDSVIVSIFSKNEDHIASSDIANLSYILKYTTDSNYGTIILNKEKEPINIEESPKENETRNESEIQKDDNIDDIKEVISKKSSKKTNLALYIALPICAVIILVVTGFIIYNRFTQKKEDIKINYESSSNIKDNEKSNSNTTH